MSKPKEFLSSPQYQEFMRAVERITTQRQAQKPVPLSEIGVLLRTYREVIKGIAKPTVNEIKIHFNLDHVLLAEWDQPDGRYYQSLLLLYNCAFLSDSEHDEALTKTWLFAAESLLHYPLFESSAEIEQTLEFLIINLENIPTDLHALMVTGVTLNRARQAVVEDPSEKTVQDAKHLTKLYQQTIESIYTISDPTERLEALHQLLIDKDQRGEPITLDDIQELLHLHHLVPRRTIKVLEQVGMPVSVESKLSHDLIITSTALAHLDSNRLYTVDFLIRSIIETDTNTPQLLELYKKCLSVIVNQPLFDGSTKAEMKMQYGKALSERTKVKKSIDRHRGEVPPSLLKNAKKMADFILTIIQLNQALYATGVVVPTTVDKLSATYREQLEELIEIANRPSPENLQ